MVGPGNVTVWILCKPARGRRPARGGFKTRFPGRAADSRQYPVWRRHTYPAALLRRCSERVHLVVEVGDRSRQGRGAGRQAETLQNFSRRIGWMNCGKNFHPAATTFTLKNVHQKTRFINSAQV